jgi:hypothetical protein
VISVTFQPGNLRPAAAGRGAWKAGELRWMLAERGLVPVSSAPPAVTGSMTVFAIIRRCSSSLKDQILPL